jgi:S1-C subfamily serine protease
MKKNAFRQGCAILMVSLFFVCWTGDIIVEADEQIVSDETAFNRIAAKHTSGGTLLLLVDRGGSTIYITLEVSI